MKIAWFCIPAHGHTNPTLGLVKELTEAGHQVYYFSFEMFREKIERAGATFIACDGYDFEMEDKENADRVGKDKAFATELLVSSTLGFGRLLGQTGGHEARASVRLLDYNLCLQPLLGQIHERDSLGYRQDALCHAQDQ